MGKLNDLSFFSEETTATEPGYAVGGKYRLSQRLAYDKSCVRAQL